MAAPAHASTGAYTEDSAANPTFAVPAGVADRDIIIVAVFVDTTATFSDLGAFAHAEGSPSALNVGGGSHSLNVLWKRASGADTGTYGFTLSASAFHAGAALRYTGCVDTGSPWDTPTDAAQDAGLTSTTPAVSISTAGPDRLVTFMGTNWGGGPWAPPTGYTERVDNGFGHLEVADLAQPSAGSTGPVTATSDVSNKRCAWLGALIPEPTADTGDLATTAPPASAALDGTVTDPAQADVTAPGAQASATGTLVAAAQFAVTAPGAAAALAGTVTASGALGSTTPVSAVSLAGTVTAAGQVHAAAPQPRAALTDQGEISWPPRARSITVRRIAHGTVSIR